MQKDEKIPLTKKGLEELKEEYQKLLAKRPAVVERMADARTSGEMTEDNEYTQAKQELSFVDGKLSELEEVINRAVVVSEGTGKHGEIGLGCKVTVKTDNEKNHQIFHLVGEWEANPAAMKISHKSPLGQSLLGKKVGDQVEVEAPAGKIIYQIIKIS